MKIVYIQTTYSSNDLIGGWFLRTRSYLEGEGGEAWMARKFTHQPTDARDLVIGSSFSCGIHYRLLKYFGVQDMASYGSTKKFLRKLDEIQPDIIHCHVVNDAFLNMKLFEDYVNRNQIKVIWTFHDARILTGQCPYPDYVPCGQWKTTCKSCPKENRYWSSENKYANMVSMVHRYRKRTIGRMENLTIVTPSDWMGGLVRESYLSSCRCLTIHNGINLNVFQRTPNKIREKYGITDSQHLLLVVANPLWKLKGRDYILRLMDELPEDYFMVVVGARPEDVEACRNRKNALVLSRIDRPQLVAFYSAADLFVNATLADNFPTVNLEAQACGCPVVSFDTGGTPETIDPVSGRLVPKGDYEALKQAILKFPYEGAREHAIRFASQYDEESCIRKYIDLYNSI